MGCSPGAGSCGVMGLWGATAGQRGAGWSHGCHRRAPHRSGSGGSVARRCGVSRCFGCLLGWIGRWEACRAPELSLRPSSRGFPQGGQPGPVCSCSQQRSRPAPWCQRGTRCQGLARGHPSCMCWVQPRVRAAPAWLVDMDICCKAPFISVGAWGSPYPICLGCLDAALPP